MLDLLKNLLAASPNGVSINFAVRTSSASGYGKATLIAIDEHGVVVHGDSKTGFYPWSSVRGITIDD